MTKAKRQGKRGVKQAAPVRGEPVVRGVLEATIEELAKVGYSGLRIEDVAARAGVNKTTVYRRWPTKEDLVRAALMSITGDTINIVSQGSLRADLIEIARRMLATTSSPAWQGVSRMLLAALPDSALMDIARSIRKPYMARLCAVVEAAEARGELAPGVDPMLLLNMLVSTVNHKLFMDREGLDEDFLGRVVDLLLHGALAPSKRKKEADRGLSRTLGR